MNESNPTHETGPATDDGVDGLPTSHLGDPVVVRSAAEHRTRSRRSFLTGLAGAAAGFGGWRVLQGRPEDGNIPDVLRRGYEFNEGLWTRIGDRSKLAPTFALDEATDIRVNGRHGVRDEIDLDAWQMRVVGLDGAAITTGGLELLDGLEPVDHVVEHKCIEGWSAKPRWTGVRFADFVQRLGVAEDYEYVAMETPDGDYYVGMDRETMLNAQTLLVTHLNGEPLTQLHGAPLRLATPHKYGVKSIKRIGLIRFTNDRPRDFWAERGYTWDAGF